MTTELGFGRFGGRGSDRAGQRDLALDAKDAVPGRPAQSKPDWAQPQKKLGLNYGKSEAPPKQERISKNPSNLPVAVKSHQQQSTQPAEQKGLVKAKGQGGRTTQLRSGGVAVGKPTKVPKLTPQEKRAHAQHQGEINKTMSAFANIRGRIRESVAKHQKAAERGQTDKKGVTVKYGKAYTPNGTVVEEGSYYRAPGYDYFLAKKILKRGDTFVVEGHPMNPGGLGGGTHSSTKWFYPTDLKPSRFSGNPGKFKSPKDFLGIEM